MAKARKTTPIQVSRVIAPCFLARAGRPLPSRPLLRDAVLLEEVLLLGRELLDELRILLVRHELRHQALAAVPFLDLGVLQPRLIALFQFGGPEEPRSDIHYLLRTSYPVSCFQKKNIQNNTIHI